ncbi:MAG: hypothetical protein WA160_03060 [Pseudobdellovibrio sp.]
MLKDVTTLDISYFGIIKPQEYLFFKRLGISISCDCDNKQSDESYIKEGLVLKIHTFGKEVSVPVDSKLDQLMISTQARGFLYYCYFSKLDIQKIKEKLDKDLNYRIYFVCHNFMDIKQEFQKIIDVDMDISRITFLISNYGQISSLHSQKNIQSVLPETKYNEFIIANTFKKIKISTKNNSESRFNLSFYFFISTAKFLLAPLQFLKMQLLIFKISRFVWLTRFNELIYFIVYLIKWVIFKLFGVFVDLYQIFRVGLIKMFYLIRHMFLMSGFKSFGVLIDLYQIFRVGLIKFFYLIRHMFLMSGFKSFGVLVDAFYFVRNIILKTISSSRYLQVKVRSIYQILIINLYHWLRILLINLYFKFRHVLLMSGFKTYGVSVDLYQIVRVFGIKLFYRTKHLFLMSGYKLFGFAVNTYHILRVIFIKLFYFSKHLLLMSGFKLFGLSVDTYNWIYDFSKNVLLFPVFKIYWFFNFQYKKRIKKNYE